MPIWKAARGYGDFANDPSLSPFEIALVAAWADGGAPEIGDRDKAPGAKPRTAIPAAPAFSPPSKNTRVRRLDCGDQPLTGRLLAVQPQLEKGSSAGIAAVLTGGRQGDRRLDPGLRSGSSRQPTGCAGRSTFLRAAGS